MTEKDEIILGIILTIGSLALGALGVHVFFQQALIRKLSVGYKGIKIKAMGINNAELDVTLTPTNPSSIDANIDSYNLVAYINGAPVANMTSSEIQYITTGGNCADDSTPDSSGKCADGNLPGQSDILVPVVFNPLQTLGKVFTTPVIMGFLFDYSKVTIRIAGTITLDHAGLKLTDYPVDISSTLADLI